MKSLRRGYYGRAILTLPSIGPVRPYAEFNRVSDTTTRVVCDDAYNIRGYLKGKGYRYSPRTRSWEPTMPRAEADAEHAWFETLSAHWRRYDL